MSGDDGSAEAPRLRVVRGAPDAAELAALTAVLLALPRASKSAVTTPRSSWASPARAIRRHPGAGLGGWRASALPR